MGRRLFFQEWGGGSEGSVWWPELGSVKGIEEKWADFRHKMNRTWSLIDLGTEDSLKKCRASHLGSQWRAAYNVTRPAGARDALLI